MSASANIHPFYKHSGKFGVHGPMLAVLAACALAFPLGIIYAYLIKYIPFIYLNFLITAGYGFVFGFVTSLLMKFACVRSPAVALLSGLAAGIIALYGNWNGHIHVVVKDAPWFLFPDQIGSVMKILYDKGSWSIGFSSSGTVSGIPLAIVWIVEALVIVGLSGIVSYGSIADLPFCEEHRCWLDEEKKMDKLDVFALPAQIAAFAQGDIAPLEQAGPRVPASGRFARLTLRYSARCNDFCAFSIANVTVTPDKDGKMQESEQKLMTNLWVPKSMVEYLEQFDRPTARPIVGI
jgi:hypothetical protein